VNRQTGDWTSVGLTGHQRLIQEVPVLTQPAPRDLVTRAGVRNESPEMTRVIETPQMHELVYQHVVADRVRHQYEAPIEADVARGRTGSPPRALVSYADAGHVKTMMLSKAQQLRGKLAGCLPPQLLDGVRTVGGRLRGPFERLRALTLDPRAVLLGKQLGMAA